MPNLDFYAAHDDWSAVLDAVFGLRAFRVFEAYSDFDRELREFSGAAEIPDDPLGCHLMLFVSGSGPEPLVQRIDLNPGACGDATFRHTVEGWGLIQLSRGVSTGRDELPWSHTNHNTEKRARAWAASLEELGDPDDWDWSAITRASGRLNRAIRRLAVGKIGSHPVLPRAAELISQADLRYEYGLGIHARPAFGSESVDSSVVPPLAPG